MRPHASFFIIMLINNYLFDFKNRILFLNHPKNRYSQLLPIVTNNEANLGGR